MAILVDLAYFLKTRPVCFFKPDLFGYELLRGARDALRDVLLLTPSQLRGNLISRYKGTQMRVGHGTDDFAHKILDETPLILELTLHGLCDRARSGPRLSHAKLKLQS